MTTTPKLAIDCGDLSIDNVIVGKLPRQDDIVRVVNAHDELVAALERIVDRLDAQPVNHPYTAIDTVVHITRSALA